MDRSVRQSVDPVRKGVHGPGVSVFGSPITSPPLVDEDRYEECLQKVLVKVENELLEVARRVT